MNYVRKLHLSRRALLRSVGASVALPFLDAMIPAAAKANPAPIPRMGFVYFPNGFIKSKWTPSATGADFDLPPSLEPLEPVKRKILVLSGLSADPSDTVGGFHDRAVASYLTGVERSRDGLRVGISVDQIAARALAEETQLASLELAIQEAGTMGSLSWRSETNCLPLELNPRLLYERMFGDVESLDAATLAQRRVERRMVLDSVTESSGALQRTLGGSDRVKLEEYLDSIRDIERRMLLADQAQAQGEAVPSIQRPAGIPATFVEHSRLMMDLLVAAMQADMTRVWTFMLGQEASNATYPEIGVSESHHSLSHDGGRPEKIAAMEKINRHQLEQFAYLAKRLDSVKEGDLTLLDQTFAVYGSGLGDGNLHIQRDLPTILAGGGALGIKSGRHLQFELDKTPLTNLYLTMLEKMGAPLEALGDSTGHLRGLDV